LFLLSCRRASTRFAAGSSRNRSGVETVINLVTTVRCNGHSSTDTGFRSLTYGFLPGEFCL
jgi:hypothetical protein